MEWIIVVAELSDAQARELLTGLIELNRKATTTNCFAYAAK